jgi:WD40 repeat protein
MADFDLFVLHAEPDEAFVRGHLLPQLGLDAASSRVMLPSKYDLGWPTLAEIDRAVSSSRFTLLVVSGAAQGDGWLQVGGLLAGSLSVSGNHRLIPVHLDDTRVDLRIGMLEGLEFADRTKWNEGIARLRTLLDQPTPLITAIECPYPGLSAFEQRDAGRFFGRDAQIRELVRRVDDGAQRICVIGPSGSGKSSLIQAGVLPQLEKGSATRDRFVVRRMQPGGDPLGVLALALGDHLTQAPRTSRLVLFIDQLEELSTNVTVETCTRFAAALRSLDADPRILIITALRADFCGWFMESELWADYEPGRYDVIPLRGSELRQAILRPAQTVAVTFDPALVERLLADTAAEPGALPLLQMTLLHLWDALETNATRYLRLADYEELGHGDQTGIATALARRANAALDRLSPTRRDVARRVFLSLIAFGDGRTHTRKRQLIASLREREEASELEATLAVLVERRLVTMDDGLGGATIDLSHEALIAAWPRLRSWIESDRADEERKRALAAKVAEWNEVLTRGVHDAKLLDAVEIMDAERYLSHTAARAGVVLGLRELVVRSRTELDTIRRQRDEAHRLLALSYEDRGRQLLVEGRPMRALPYLDAARRVRDDDERPQTSAALHLSFGHAARALPIAALAHRDRIDCIAFSPDSAYIMTASRDGTVAFWDTVTGGRLGEPLLHDGPVLDAAFSTDGERVVTACEDGKVRCWLLGSRRMSLPPLHHGVKAHLASFSRDGRLILAASWERAARVWSSETGQPVTDLIRRDDNIVAARFSPDAAHVVIVGGRNAAIYDSHTGELLVTLPHEEIVHSAAFSPDGSRLVTASSDHKARVWSTATGKPLFEVPHGVGVGHAEFSLDGLRVLSVSDVSAVVSDASSGEKICQVKGWDFVITAAAFGSRGDRIMVARSDRKVGIYDVGSGSLVGLPLELSREATRLAVDHLGHRIAAVTGDRSAWLWDLDRASTSCRTIAHSARWVLGVAFDAFGARVASAGADRTVRTLDTATDAIGPVMEHDQGVTGVVFSPDGSRVLSAAHEQASLWETTTGRRIRTLDHSKQISTIAFRPDGKRIATAGRDRELKIWDALGDGRDPLHVRLHPDALVGAWYSPDGAWIATGCGDGRARLWGEIDGDCPECGQQPDGHSRCVAHAKTISHVAFDRDSTRVATSSRDHTARIWEIRSGEPCVAPLVHDEDVRHIAFSPNGELVVTISDSTVRVWNARSGRPTLDPLVHRGPVYVARFSPDGALLATGGYDAKLWIWDVSTGKLVVPPLAHGYRINDLAFSPNGRCIATASGDTIVRLWTLEDAPGSVKEWSTLLERCPFKLFDGVLVERETTP